MKKGRLSNGNIRGYDASVRDSRNRAGDSYPQNSYGDWPPNFATRGKLINRILLVISMQLLPTLILFPSNPAPHLSQPSPNSTQLALSPHIHPHPQSLKPCRQQRTSEGTRGCLSDQIDPECQILARHEAEGIDAIPKLPLKLIQCSEERDDDMITC